MSSASSSVPKPWRTAPKVNETGEKGSALRFSPEGKLGVFVPQNRVVFFKRSSGREWVATTGLATCVGVMLVNHDAVCFAHLDAEDDKNGKTVVEWLASWMLGRVPEPTRVFLVNPLGMKSKPLAQLHGFFGSYDPKPLTGDSLGVFLNDVSVAFTSMDDKVAAKLTDQGEEKDLLYIKIDPSSI